MKIKNDDDILKQEFRLKFIQEIGESLNTSRKEFMKRRFDVFKDDTKKYVLKYFQNESSDKEVLSEIKNRTSNISFCRKIIDKKCMVYKDGAKREVTDGNEQLQNSLNVLEDLLNINSVMKKTNKFEELFKNSLVQVMPYETSEGWKVKLNVLPPFLYDVIEDANNPENAKAIVFSNYNPERSGVSYTQPDMSGYRNKTTNPTSASEDLNQVLADINHSPDDAIEYVWWSENYHFTTDEKGNILPGRQEDDLSNPIGELPFVDFCREKDGSFWGLGGEDIIESTILLNVLLTDLYYIAKFQGMGIGYMFGKGVPKNMKVGPSTFVTLEVEQGDPTPQLGFASSNPPVDSHIKMIEGQLAYLLSTNNLDAGTIVGTLTVQNSASGVQEAIKRADNLDDIEDQQEVYRDNEPVLFRLAFKWIDLFFSRGLLAPEFEEVGRIPVDTKVAVRFNKPHTYLSEKERLDVIEKRLTLGLDSKIDAIMQDNPDLTKEEAEEKMERINEETATAQKNRLKMYIPENMNEKMNQNDNQEDKNDQEDEME